ncbi:MAG: hypothetical protein ABI614_09815, partial [Planctomycetota bacterium]
ASLQGMFQVAWDFPSVEPPEYLRLNFGRRWPATYRKCNTYLMICSWIVRVGTSCVGLAKLFRRTPCNLLFNQMVLRSACTAKRLIFTHWGKSVSLADHMSSPMNTASGWQISRLSLVLYWGHSFIAAKLWRLNASGWKRTG